MQIFKTLLPEFIYLIGAALVTVGIWSVMGAGIAILFIGAVMIIASNFVIDTMEFEDE